MFVFAFLFLFRFHWKLTAPNPAAVTWSIWSSVSVSGSACATPTANTVPTSKVDAASLIMVSHSLARRLARLRSRRLGLIRYQVNKVAVMSFDQLALQANPSGLGSRRPLSRMPRPYGIGHTPVGLLRQ